jgi:hypothetical protein
MTQAEKRVKIAEKCGLSVEVVETGGYYAVIHRNEKHPNGYQKSDHYISKESAVRKLPDYFNSLDAMHEAEKILDKSQQTCYAGWLEYGKNCFVQDFITNVGIFRIAHKTAEQRAEAFGKALDLWD